MTTLDSSSTSELSMDDNGHHHHNRRRRRRSLQTLTNANSSAATTVTTNGHSPGSGGGGGSFGDQEDDGATANLVEGGGDPEVWRSFAENFQQVQSVLDRNRVLIQQVNENHQSKIPDNLVKNVALIQEINGNISKVVSMYSDFSSNFSTIFRQPNGEGKARGDQGKG